MDLNVAELRAKIEKYSVSGPRYTSYPPANHWDETVDGELYRRTLESRRPTTPGDDDAVALYVHLPFCESLCYYCGCNIHITKDKSRSERYVEAVLTELRQVAPRIGERKVVQLNWGGGTPTFLKPEEIRRLHEGTRELFRIAPEAEVRIEVDPRVTTDAHLTTLAELGFNGISLGVQDFDPDVQKAIHRIQPAEITHAMLKRGRELGFGGTNFDLIYGLPLQTVESFAKTIDQVIEMRPDRIALYNYARLPELLPHQKLLEKYRMPTPEERLSIFLMACEKLVAAGYDPIGMDHFALREDALAKALHARTLHRNFMGYAVQRSRDLIGVGASAIGEVDDKYFQNVKKPDTYEQRVRAEGVATLRGWRLSPDDIRRKWIIQRIFCAFELDTVGYGERFGHDFNEDFAGQRESLAAFVDEGFLAPTGDRFQITPLGRLFVRNIAMLFDAYLAPETAKVYSRTV